MKITESDIKIMISECVKRLLKESYSDDAPAIYVGTYGKYNNGSLKGEWVNLTDFDSKEEFLQYCQNLHSDEPDAELMFQDYENIPKCFIGESYIDERFWDFLNDNNYDYDVKYAVANYYNDADDYFDNIDNIIVWHGCNDMSDVAMEYIAQLEAEGVGVGDRYFDYEKFGSECSYDGPSKDSGAESIYQEYGVQEDNDYELGEAIVDQIYGGVENLPKETIENYIDYEAYGRDLSYDSDWIDYDDGIIEVRR